MFDVCSPATASGSEDADARPGRDRAAQEAERQVSGGHASSPRATEPQLQEPTVETAIQQYGSMDGKVDSERGDDAAWNVCEEDAKARSEQCGPQLPDHAYEQQVRDLQGNTVTAYLPVRRILDRHSQFWAEGGQFLQRKEEGGRNVLRLRVARTFEGHPGILVDNKSACRSHATPMGCLRENCNFLHASPGNVVSSLPPWGFHVLGPVSVNDPCMTHPRTQESLRWSAMDLADINAKSERAISAMESTNRARGMVNQASAQWSVRMEAAIQQGNALALNQASERAATPAIGYQAPASAELPSLEPGNAAAVSSQVAIAPSVATMGTAPPVHAKPEPTNATGSDNGDLRATVASLLARLEGYEAKRQQPNRPPRLSRRQRKKANRKARRRQVTPSSSSTDSSRSSSPDRKAHKTSRGSRRRSRDRDSRRHRSRDRERSRERGRGRPRSRRDRSDSRSRGHRKAERRSRSRSRHDSSSRRRDHHDEHRSRSHSRHDSSPRRRDHRDDTPEDSRGSDSDRASTDRTPERSKKERR